MSARAFWPVAACAAALSWHPAFAQVALYGVQPPPGSAFVRIVNASDAPVALKTNFGGAQTLGTGSDDRVGAYAVIDHAASRTLEIDAHVGSRVLHEALRVAADSYDTILVVATQEGLSMKKIVDQAAFDQARVRLAFYNATPSCGGGSLVLKSQGIAVFASLAPGATAMRSVNPVEADLAADCTGEGPQNVSLKGLSAGNSYSLWLMLPGGHPVAFLTRDKTLPYQP